MTARLVAARPHGNSSKEPKIVLPFADQSRMQPKGRLMADLSCDVAIIGAGTAGLAAERTARNAGAKTLLIDDRFAGTTCASVGCMPSKLLIAAADAAHGVRRAS